MTGNEIRRRFLDFFKERGHLVQPSAPLSINDPTLLFTIAGMVPFKAFFLGEKKPPASRLTSCQVCFRTSDLEKVGQTSHHHTLFEMLGNFSLGDYFKEEACEWGWEFVTKELGLGKENLWITIFREDDETHQIWKKIGIPSSKILKKGEEDNFWSLAEVGLCGPDTEIFFDRGQDFGCGRTNCEPGCSCSRWIELWNLVFMQFNRDKAGRLSSLPSRNIDTGMGLERTASVLQGVEDDYQTDLFSPILDWLRNLLPDQIPEEKSFRTICDHLRALTFLLGEEILPSNVGRGYVVRRILRRSHRLGRRLGLEDPFLYQGVSTVVKLMEEPYPHLKKKQDQIASVIKAEEENFRDTLSRGMRILDTLIGNLKAKGKKLIPPRDVFQLYDTYGFPIELTEEIAGEEGLRINKEEYDKLLTEQRERSRKITIEDMVKVGEDVKVAVTRSDRVRKEIFEKLKLKYNLDPAKIFQGYTSLELDTTLVGIIKRGLEAEKIVQGEQAELILKSTPFYAEGGGQIGDRGLILTSTSQAEVLDTQKMDDELILHQVKMLKGMLKKGEKVIAQVNKKRRKSICRAHTATHLLQAVLREILGRTVKQSGSLVDEDRLRFDFTYFSAITKTQLQKITLLLNKKIREVLPVTVEETTLDEAHRRGAIALFEPKYKEKVRLVKIGKFSKEVCGGTHLSNLGEIGLMKIISEASIASGARRIEALVGERALKWDEEKENLLKTIATKLGTSENGILTRLQEKEERLQNQDKQLKRWQEKSINLEIAKILDRAQEIGTIKVVSGKWDNLSASMLRKAAEKLKAKLKKGIVVLASVSPNKAFLVAASTQKNLSADEIVKEVCHLAGGSGGGRWDFAQGGTSQPSKVNRALEKVSSIVEKHLLPTKKPG
jgi:alanyl-tRNA synthetase